MKRFLACRYGISCVLPGPFAGPLANCFSNSKSFERAARFPFWATCLWLIRL